MIWSSSRSREKEFVWPTDKERYNTTILWHRILLVLHRLIVVFFLIVDTHMDESTGEDAKISLVVTYTKDVRKKKGKKWLDGTLKVCKRTRQAILYDGEEGGDAVARIERLPSDVCVSKGGGDAFVMREQYDQGREYLVQVDDAPDGDQRSPLKDSRLINAKVLAHSLGGMGKRAADTELPRCPAPVQKQDNHDDHDGNDTVHVRKRRTTQEILDILGIGSVEAREEKKEETRETKDVTVNDWKTPVERVLKNSNATHQSLKEDAREFSSLVCPSVEECQRPVRRVFVPTRFESTRQYLHVMEKAILEEGFLRLIDATMVKFYSALSSSPKSDTMSASWVEQVCQRSKIGCYHGECHLKIFSKRRDGTEEASSKKESVFLTLGSHRGKASEYHKSDLWVLSNDPTFFYRKPAKATTWTCIVKSLWHGPNKDGKFEVSFVSKKPTYVGKSCKVFAIQGPEVAIEMDHASLFASDDSMRAPILPRVLHKVGGEKEYSVDNIASKLPAFDEIRLQFNLNVHQLDALAHVAAWHVNPSMNPVCLVHGPFGTGKSQLLVSMLHLIMKLRETRGGLSNARVLVCSHTNIAVDRVCIGLMQSSMDTFLRVGPVRKIHHSLLSYSLHASDSKSHASALSELKDMAKGANGEVLEKLKIEIAAIEKGADRKRKKLFKTCPIVGVTCVSTALEVLQDQTFDILVLDEASQLTEPLSLAPMIRSKCKYVIAAGDPNQLPPVVCSPEKVQGENVNGLVRPLFVRLVGLGHVPHLLKTQYRCHPHISSISNKFFYDNKLEDGISMEDRKSLISSVPSSVAIIDVPFGLEGYSHRSIYNDAEARSVASMTKVLVDQGIPTVDIGIIAFYKAHVDCLRSHVRAALQEQDADSLQIATVDSFQGAEKNVIILSTATTKPSSFAGDACRLNVAITRAKRHLLLAGNIHALAKGIPVFDFMLSRAKAQGGYYLGGLPRSCNAPPSLKS